MKTPTSKQKVQLTFGAEGLSEGLCARAGNSQPRHNVKCAHLHAMLPHVAQGERTSRRVTRVVKTVVVVSCYHLFDVTPWEIFEMPFHIHIHQYIKDITVFISALRLIMKVIKNRLNDKFNGIERSAALKKWIGAAPGRSRGACAPPGQNEKEKNCDLP
ncbi:unnamed protein product [Nesidiocoris tenuis]|uniref:Uncharacterized protein n=1 Tax=Nesidiocoris tenuis TaxID=355587 RepID=A0A6H5HDK7_9HEMI|nr:unnamed protein product [Nesidiocoris tenuis]